MKKVKPPASFVRRTISLPLKIDRHANRRAAADHYGNLSAYFRRLIEESIRNQIQPSNDASQ